MKLGTLLLRDAVIGLSQLEAALRAQVLYGGRLGTNLVELGFLDVNTLGLYLAKLHRVPVAAADRFEAVDRGIVRDFGAELAARHTAFPLGFEEGGSARLAVAFAEPRAEEALADIARTTGHEVEPYAAAELRILYYLERHYGLARKARFLRSADERAPIARSSSERRRVQPVGGIVMPGAVRLDPKKKDAGGGGAAPVEPRPEPSPPVAASHAPAREPRLGYRDACDVIDGAAHRDQIGEALVEYTAGRFEVAAIFLVRRQNAVGWRAQSALAPSVLEAIEQLILPLGGASVFQSAHDAGRPYRGGPLSAGRPVERELWRVLGVICEPEEMLVVPVIVRDRPVNLLYAHGFAGAAIPDRFVEELAELAVRAAGGYLRLIKELKAQGGDG